MNIKRFHAATSREALAKARMTFGEGTLILSNRPTATGVEVVATAEDMLSSIVPTEEPQAPMSLKGPAPKPTPAAPSPAPTSAPASKTPVEQDTEQLAMSTLSFQDYVRERMLRRRHEAIHGPSDIAFEPAPLPTPAPPPAAMAPAFQHSAPRKPAPPRARESAAPATTAPAGVNAQGIVNELQAMKELIEERFNTLAWLGQARQDPLQSNLMLKLIRTGYSPAMARAVLERMPEAMAPAEAVRWLMDVLVRNLKTDAGAKPLVEEGGVFALVGATGVGKTTTAAKLAAHCARMHGPASVGLITLDTYRIAAHEQLRSYGRMLGVVAHLAHDRAALQDLLGLLSGKKMILIDTTGVAPRDPRKREMLDVLDLPGIKRLLVLNAGSHGDTHDDVMDSFKTSGTQYAVLSKIDEAVKLGPALDAVIRHQLTLRGVTNGQRVPEDWEAADANKLVRLSMRSPAKSAFDPKATDLSFFFSQPASQTLLSEGLADA
ncbi:MAG TPA: flagellar biosynthesis protein FlhF [Burkholderiaceae bacterium]|nr:flagellar biosynthesis protein FlhF [Burkholderiaceae bacterium]